MSKKDNDNIRMLKNDNKQSKQNNNETNIQKQNKQSSILCLGLVLAIVPALFLSSSISYFQPDNTNNGLLVYAQENQITVPGEQSMGEQSMGEQSMGEQNDTDSIKTSSLPQPNDDDAILNVQASNALFEPAAGLSNVFGPEGLFPFDNFNCADDLTCGVSAGDNAEFTGTFDKGNNNGMTKYEATYTSPVTYGPHQIAGHEYKITLTDLLWNSSDASLPTEQPQFATSTNNVGFNQIQHGASNIDRSDVPQLSNEAFLYGHAQVTDITNGNNTVVAEDVFTHVMVGHVMDEQTFYQDLRDEALSPNFVFLFAMNIPDDTELPGVGSLTAEQAQAFTPLESDESLTNDPPIDYPIEIPEPRNEMMAEIEEPDAQSTVWPVANKEQPLLFTFLVYQDTDIKLQ